MLKHVELVVFNWVLLMRTFHTKHDHFVKINPTVCWMVHWMSRWYVEILFFRFFPSERITWTKIKHRWCSVLIKSYYHSLEAVQAACLRNEACVSVFDGMCNDDYYQQCGSRDVHSNLPSCVYKFSRETFPGRFISLLNGICARMCMRVVGTMLTWSFGWLISFFLSLRARCLNIIYVMRLVTRLMFGRSNIAFSGCLLIYFITWVFAWSFYKLLSLLACCSD